MKSRLVTACLLTLAAAPASPESVAPSTIAIDLGALDRPTFERLESAGIYQALVLRLVGESVALVDPRGRADYKLRFESSAPSGELRLSAAGPGGARSRSLDIRSLDQDAVRLQVVHAAIELVRQVRALAPPPPPPAARPELARLSTRVELTAGGLSSGGSAGLVVRVAGMRRLGPVDVGVSGWLHRPVPMPSHLAFTEWGAFAVLGTGERALGPRLRVSAALELGVRSQQFSYTGPDGRDKGSRLDPAAALQGGVAWRLAPSWRAGLAVGVLVSRGRSHQDSTGQLFRTPALRPFGGLTLAFGREGER
jgi:hypothetical protein